MTNYTLWGIMNHSGTSYKAGRVSTDYLIYNITTELYDKVAEIHNTNRLNVERNIRTVIENAYDRTPELLLEFFSYLPDS